MTTEFCNKNNVILSSVITLCSKKVIGSVIVTNLFSQRTQLSKSFNFLDPYIRSFPALPYRHYKQFSFLKNVTITLLKKFSLSL